MLTFPETSEMDAKAPSRRACNVTMVKVDWSIYMWMCQSASQWFKQERRQKGQGSADLPDSPIVPILTVQMPQNHVSGSREIQKYSFDWRLHSNLATPLDSSECYDSYWVTSLFV